VRSISGRFKVQISPDKNRRPYLKNNQSKRWRCVSSDRAPACKCKALKKRKLRVEITRQITQEKYPELMTQLVGIKENTECLFYLIDKNRSRTEASSGHLRALGTKKSCF
jgi:hypothetical protein